MNPSLSKISARQRGFTVVELIVAMAVTTVIVSVLVSITSIALDTWNRGRSELRSSAQAKAMLDTMARDFETIVYRRGNFVLRERGEYEPVEWFHARAPQTMPGPTSFRSTNAMTLAFFTAAADRYNGNIGNTSPGSDVSDKGGNISLVAYGLNYRQPLSVSAAGTTGNSLILNRFLRDPDEAIKNMGLASLDAEMDKFEGDQLRKPEYFVAENIYQFTLTFNVEITPPTPPGAEPELPVVIPLILSSDSPSNNAVKSLKINSGGITVDRAVSGYGPEQIKAGRLMSVEIAVTVLGDQAVQQIQQRSFGSTAEKAKFINQNCYQYSKLVTLPVL